MRISFARNDVVDHVLALQRELTGRYSWETNLLEHPVSADIDGLRRGVMAWHSAGNGHLTTALTEAERPADLFGLLGSEAPDAAVKDTIRALYACWSGLASALDPFVHLREEAERAVGEVLQQTGPISGMCAALGTPEPPGELRVFLVPFAPHPPAAGLFSGGPTRAVYLDCRRFRGATAVDTALSLVGWSLLLESTEEGSFTVELARRLPGAAPYRRRLRALATKLTLEFTAGFLTRRYNPGHRMCVETLGTAARYPRLFAVVERSWGAYLDGRLSRADAFTALTSELAARSPRWFVDHVDPSSLAADFYILELLSSRGHTRANNLLGQWLPGLCRDLHTHLDAVVANELGHYERADGVGFESELAPFLADLGAGDSRVNWPAVRATKGHPRALALAEAAFGGPGAAYGGNAWKPVATMLRRYVLHQIPDRVFVDQCFTLEHNNGSLFDKFFDTTHMRPTLDEQARGELDSLALRASAQVRLLWAEHRDATTSTSMPAVAELATLPGADRWPAPMPLLADAPPGALGCGSHEEASAWAPDRDSGPSDAVRTRSYAAGRPIPPPVHADATAALLRTDLGDVSLQLWPERKPRTVDDFTRLARGTRPWRDPITGETRTTPYYDGTVFQRRVPGFLVQGGDPSGTGRGGPGYRIIDEFDTSDDFTQPFVLAMANLGRDSAGGQFFVTLAPLPHLAGRYAAFGRVADQASQEVLVAVAESTNQVRLRTVRVGHAN